MQPYENSSGYCGRDAVGQASIQQCEQVMTGAINIIFDIINAHEKSRAPLIEMALGANSDMNFHGLTLDCSDLFFALG
jgi:hypothetical protein